MSHSIFLKDLIKKYNADPNSFTSDSMFVKSYQVGQSTYFKKVTNSSFWAIRENEALFWLVPKAKLSISEFNREAIEGVFVCRNHDSKGDGKKFTLIRPVKLELVPETGDLAFQEKGILDFGIVSDTRLTDLEYWVSETEDLLVQSLAKRIPDQFNELMKKEIEAIKSELARLDNEQHNHISSPLYFDNWVKINVEKEKLKTELRTVFTEKFALLDKFTQFVDRFTPVLCFIEQKFQQLQQDQKRTQSQPWENSGDTPPVPSKTENNVTVNAPKKVQHSDIPNDLDIGIIEFIRYFNQSSNAFIANCRSYWKTVAEDKDSFVRRYQGELGQSMCFSEHPSGVFLAVLSPVCGLDSNTYWLFPKPDQSPNEYNMDVWEICFGYDKSNHNHKQYLKKQLIYPAKLIRVENKPRFEMVASGKINFILNSV